MTWFRCGGGGSGIPTALKNRMNAVFNKKFGTAVDYPAEDWPDDVNLMGVLQEKTIASSPIADFSDGAKEVPTKNVIATIAPTLTGVSSVTETQTGRNLLNPTYLEDGYSLGADGLPMLVAKRIATTTPVPIHGGNITISYNTSVNTVQFMYATFKNDTLIERVAGKTNGSTINAQNADEIYISLYDTQSSDITGGSIVTNIQIEIGSTVHAYEPYQTPTQYAASLGRTIYGGQADLVNGEGQETYKNYVLDNLTWSGGNVQGVWCWYVVLTDDGLKLPENSAIFDGICDNYVPIRYNGVGGTVNTIALRSTGYLYVNNGSNTITPTGKVTIALATPTDFTFDGQEISTRLGYNAFWSDQGDTEVTYRSSGTMTPITPTLITKTITANGSYQAADDQADGYSEIVVNVPSGTPFKYESVNSSDLSYVFIAMEEGDYLCVLYCSYDGTRTFSTTGTLIFEEDINVTDDSRGIKVALCHLLPNQRISHQATSVNLYNSRLQAIIKLDDSISVSQMVDSYAINDGNTSGYTPSYSGNVLSVAVCGGNNTEHFYDKTIPRDSAIENSVNGGLNSILHIGFGACPNYDMYGYYGNGVFIGLFQ